MCSFFSVKEGLEQHSDDIETNCPRDRFILFSDYRVRFGCYEDVSSAVSDFSELFPT